ncbi:MAG: hypothetical protein MJ218_02865 [Opitutales bacterium]|nr:hypothetical protein [Opitutales bacterium]
MSIVEPIDGLVISTDPKDLELDNLLRKTENEEEKDRIRRFFLNPLGEQEKIILEELIKYGFPRPQNFPATKASNDQSQFGSDTNRCLFSQTVLNALKEFVDKKLDALIETFYTKQQSAMFSGHEVEIVPERKVEIPSELRFEDDVNKCIDLSDFLRKKINQEPANSNQNTFDRLYWNLDRLRSASSPTYLSSKYSIDMNNGGNKVDKKKENKISIISTVLSQSTLFTNYLKRFALFRLIESLKALSNREKVEVQYGKLNECKELKELMAQKDNIIFYPSLSSIISKIHSGQWLQCAYPITDELTYDKSWFSPSKLVLTFQPEAISEYGSGKNIYNNTYKKIKTTKLFVTPLNNIYRYSPYVSMIQECCPDEGRYILHMKASADFGILDSSKVMVFNIIEKI